MRAWVEIDCCTRLAIRVFKNRKLAMMALQDIQPAGDFNPRVKEMDRAQAVKQIREQLFSIQEGRCLDCNEIIYWDTMHLHERKHRGEFSKENVNNRMEIETSGEISLVNSVALCGECHQREHADRQVRP